MAVSSNKRILITTKVSNYDGHFTNFMPIQQVYDWDACYFLLKKFFSEIIQQENNGFKTSFSEFKIKDSNTDEEFDLDITNENFIDDKDFVEQIVNNSEVYSRFISKLKTSTFLKKQLLQNEDSNIWIFPTISDNYVDKNVNYIESLIKWSKKDNPEGDLYLLLHDKDIFSTIEPIKHHKAEYGEASLSKTIKDNSSLMSLIRDGKVFVFIHNSDEDCYCKNIVNNPQLYQMDVSTIVNILTCIHKNFSLSLELAKQMRISDMHSTINKLSNDNFCDFSLKFLE